MPKVIYVNSETMDRCIRLMTQARDAMNVQRLVSNYDYKSTITAAPKADAVIGAMNEVRSINVLFFNEFINDLTIVRDEMRREDERIEERIPHDLG